MAYKVIILYQLYMPSYFLGTFTEYPLQRTVFIYTRPTCHYIHSLTSFPRYRYYFSNTRLW